MIFVASRRANEILVLHTIGWALDAIPREWRAYGYGQRQTR